MTSPVAKQCQTCRCRNVAVLHARRLWTILVHTSPWILILPGMVSVSTIGASYRMFWPVVAASYYERIGTWILGAAFVAATTCWVLRGDFFHLWLVCLTGVFFCRALQFAGSEFGAAVAIAILIGYALVKFDDMQPYLQQRLVVSLLVGGLVCQCLPLLVTHDLWVAFTQLGIWRNRIHVAAMLSGRSMILLAIICSEIMSRTGWIANAESPPFSLEAASFNPEATQPRRAA